ncbi:hypothetical protein ACOL23_09590 [Aliarcobacter butzleri]
MNRRDLLKSLVFLPIASLSLFAKESIKDNTFKISMFGDLDDDLIVIKSNKTSNSILDIHQMHNSKGKFIYEGNSYDIEQNPGYIQFSKKYKIEEDDIYCVCLANEMDDAEMPVSKRIRTHFKNEKLFYNKDILLRDLMPEYNSVPNYPLWFNEGDIPFIDREDLNGNLYNYYNLFENTVAQVGLILPRSGTISIMLFDQKNQLVYTFKEEVTTTPRYLESEELKSGKLNKHPFTEIGNIVNPSTDNPIENNNYITNMIVAYNEDYRKISFPYPVMYPNLISAVAVAK